MVNPYEVLGISSNATREEIKMAYRREAMKWHPDRNDNSSEARHRFQQAADAYRTLSSSSSSAGSTDYQDHSSGGYGQQDSASDYSSDSRQNQQGTDENTADTVFWDVMLDYAIKLAQSGLGESQIFADLRARGCPDRLASVIADKAFNIHAHYASSAGNNYRPGNAESTFKEERLEEELLRAFIGGRNFFFSPRDTFEYYLVVFNDFRNSAIYNPFSLISPNKRLLKILNFSILFFVLIVAAINFFPDQTEYRLLSDLTLVQLPIGLLSLMFVWSIYRKLWFFTLFFCSIYLLTLVLFNAWMPAAMYSDYLSILPVAITCYAPFIFIVLFANYFYYRKAEKTIARARNLFESHQDKVIWIQNRAGTSDSAAIMIIFIFLASLLFLGPKSEEYLDAVSFDLLDTEVSQAEHAAQITRTRVKDAELFFKIAESHFNSSPPNYLRASMAYSNAVDNGSLLAAYKLGYMYYTGEGVEQNDLQARDYFELATRAPLAFQPHKLQLATRFLAESYNNLGIMYEAGYGTRKNLKLAREMYNKAVDFGSENAKLNLRNLRSSSAVKQRKRLQEPDYE